VEGDRVELISREYDAAEAQWRCEEEVDELQVEVQAGWADPGPLELPGQIVALPKFLDPAFDAVAIGCLQLQTANQHVVPIAHGLVGHVVLAALVAVCLNPHAFPVSS